MKNFHNDTLVKDWISNRKKVICSLGASMSQEKPFDYGKSSDYATQLYPSAITHDRVVEEQMKVNLRIHLQKGNVRTIENSHATRAKVISPVSNRLKGNMLNTPPVGSKIPVLTPLENNIAFKRNDPFESPDNVPVHITSRKLCFDIDDCKVTENVTSDTKIHKSRTNKACSKSLITPKIDKKMKTLVDNGCRIPKLRSGVTEITKSVSKISIYSDESENVPSTSANNQPSRLAQKRTVKTERNLRNRKT